MRHRPAGQDLWLADCPLVLASRSAARRAMLESLLVPFEVHAPDVDERAVEAGALHAGTAGRDIALTLAREKAVRTSIGLHGRVVLAADQVVIFEGEILHKPASRAELRDRLLRMSGRSHQLETAAVLAQDGSALFDCADTAEIRFRSFSSGFVEKYLNTAGAGVYSSAAGYELEAAGMHLVDRIDGQFSTILGLPIAPVLEQLRRMGLLAT